MLRLRGSGSCSIAADGRAARAGVLAVWLAAPSLVGCFARRVVLEADAAASDAADAAAEASPDAATDAPRAELSVDDAPPPYAACAINGGPRLTAPRCNAPASTARRSRAAGW